MPFKMRALINKENNELRLTIAQQADEAKRVAIWLGRHLANLNIGISEAYLFGSITHNYYESDDVDVVLKFRDMNDKEYVKKERKLTPIAKDFNRTFGKRLHFQRYLASESNEFERFVSMQSEPISILRS
ncbi:MAG: hypothetical protein HYX79_02490 [Chloroflexi bacterium]|nr:hypothetical protein [Chloroflexota bacterium]